MTKEEKLKKLQEILKIIDGGGVTRQEFLDSFKGAVSLIIKREKMFEEKLNRTIAKINKTIVDNYAITDKKADTTLKKFQSSFGKMMKEQEDGMNFMRDKVRSLKNGYTPIKGKDYFDGAPADMEKLKNELLVLLDFKELKKLIDELKQLRGSSPRGIQIFGQMAGRPLEETPTNSGDNLNFTISFFPRANTFHLYRNGLRQASTADYSIDGKTITLTTAFQAGETLIAEYVK